MTTKMTGTRGRQIEAIAQTIAAGRVSLLGYDDDYTRADIGKKNADGWTFSLPGSLGSIVRHEGVVLAPAELETAITRSDYWFTAELGTAPPALA